MAHRIAKKQHAKHQQNEIVEQQPQTPSYYQAEKAPTQSQGKLPRPILFSSDSVYSHDKFSYKQGKLAFPQPQSLFTSANNYDAGPQFIRPTSAVVFGTPRKSNFPLGAWITPFGSDQVHRVHVNSPLRCSRCRAYVNGYFRFDGTKSSAICNICGINFGIDHATVDSKNLNSTEIATEGVMDFVVKDKIFRKKRTDIVKIILVVEINSFMIESNAFSTIMESTRAALENYEFEKNIRIGFVLFNGQGVTYLKQTRSENWDKKHPKKYTVKYSTQGLCCPLSDKELLFDPQSQKQQLLYMIECIKQIAEEQHKNSKYTTQGANYAVVLKTIMQNFQNQIGRVLMFSCTTPRAGPMALRVRNQEDNKLPLKPLSNDYHQLSKELVKARIGVDMYIISKEALASQQLPTTHSLAAHTGGSIHLYSPYVPENHGENLYYNIYGSLTRKYVYDVELTARVSNGLTMYNLGIGEGLHQHRDASLSMMDPLHSVAVNFIHEQKIEQNSSAFIQFAIMFTTGNGQRIIRIINYRFQITNKIQVIHQACDSLGIANILMRQAAHKLVRGDALKVREELVHRLVAIIGEFVQEGGNKMRASNFMAHPNFAPALAYIHSFINSKVFLNQLKVPIDFQICQVLKVNNYNFFNFSNAFYPKLFSLGLEIYESSPVPGDLIENEGELQQIVVLPPSLPLTGQSLAKDGVYLHWAADYLLILVQPEASSELLTSLFGTDNWDQIQELTALPELQEDGHNIRVHLILEELRRRSSKEGIYLPLLIRTPKKKGPYNDLLNMVLKEDILECKYFSFLDSIHRNVQTRLK